jgi:hypothetical protein
MHLLLKRGKERQDRDLKVREIPQLGRTIRTIRRHSNSKRSHPNGSIPE